MNSVDWEDLIRACRPSEPVSVRALTYRRSWDSACRPVQVTCDDGNDYVAKGCQVARSAFNDQVVGRIAHQLGAPVAEVGLVEIAPELIHINSEMAHVTPGLAHGSRYVPGCTECLWIQHADEPENRPRFALLSVLYGWMIAAEKQFFYSINPPNLVYSFDHDAFFPRGPEWSIESLESAKYPEEDDVIVAQCGLRTADLKEAAQYLDRITPEIIATAIGSVPVVWRATSDDEHLALARYLWERCETMRS